MEKHFYIFYRSGGLPCCSHTVGKEQFLEILSLLLERDTVSEIRIFEAVAHDVIFE